MLFDRYVALLFLRLLLAAQLGLCGLFLTFDSLANLSDVLANQAAIWPAMGDYLLLRSASIAILVAPMASLLAALLLMIRFVRSQEIVAMNGVGYSIYRLVLALIVAGLPFAAGQLALSEYWGNDHQAQLRLWAQDDYRGRPPPPPSDHPSLWAEHGGLIFHADHISDDGTIYQNPTVTLRNGQGGISRYLHAKTAYYENGTGLWQFEAAYGQGIWGWVDPSTPTRPGVAIPKSLKFSLPITPNDFRQSDLLAPEQGLTSLWGMLRRLNHFSDRQDLWLWFQRKLIEPLTPLLMILLAAPVGLYLHRQFNPIMTSFAFITTGFGYFVTERLLLSLGESGLLPLPLALWAPPMGFALLCLWLLIHRQD